ncbi:MAG: M14 family zinc carboxypeptidase [Ignavibacteriae bacterium]|nr:M14 family zinc carboxypeptidase [Ignavibacteriota bacterium]
MKKNLLLTVTIFIVASFLFTNLFAQKNNNSGQEKYSKVRISLKTSADARKLASADLHLDGGINKPGEYFETWLSESEIALLNKSGVAYTVEIADWMEYYNRLQSMSPAEFQKTFQMSQQEILISNHSIMGTMGGHLKVAEMITKVDSLRTQYPTLVSAKWSIGNTYENRPMWTVRITKNPDVTTGRPEIWLNGVTHAREPLGMSNVLYYVYWLVENYNIDPIATYILNNREIYWTPIINVDGYYYNETTNPTGGGMWRKNRNPAMGGPGVDINRNFGTYNFWNSVNGGSSTTPSSDTYRGPSPFSEIETQNFRTFYNSRNFTVNLDYHTYGNYLIKPYAWCDPTPTPDDNVFNEYGSDIVAENHFLFGTPLGTVAYAVRGGDIDWCYSNDSTGHATHRFGMTPEVGVIGFWPPQASILPEAQTCLEMNKYYTLVAGDYVGLRSATLNKASYLQSETGNLKVVFRNKGRVAASNVKVELTPLSGYLNVPTQIYTKPTLGVFVSDSVTFNFTVGATAPNNSVIYARLRLRQNDTVTMYDKNVSIFVGNGYTILRDSAENGTTNFPTMTNWSIVTNKYLSPTHSFKGVCLTNTVSQMISVPLNVSSYPAVYLNWYQKYALETGYDMGFVDVSGNNGTSWTRIATFNGLDSSTWKLQSFNISSIVNGSTNMLVRFRDSCDSGVNWDGWYVDNINVTAFQTVPTSVGNNGGVLPVKYELNQNYPNPFNPVTKINFALPKDGFVKITIFDLLGREVRTLVNESKTAGYYSVDFSGENLSSGFYFYKMESASYVETKKMMLIK